MEGEGMGRIKLTGIIMHLWKNDKQTRKYYLFSFIIYIILQS